MKHFHNTIDLPNESLKVANNNCITQEQKILAFFEKHPNEEFTPPEIQLALSMYSTPLTSLRRAISNLTKSEKLVMTDNKKMGIYGMKNYTWRLNIPAGQRTLF
jgi:hypothetical protein